MLSEGGHASPAPLAPNIIFAEFPENFVKIFVKKFCSLSAAKQQTQNDIIIV